MRAIMIHAPHDLRVEGFPGGQAPQPGPGEVLVRMAAGGICGSDLHYYHHGGFGTVRVREPMALGHEASGRVIALGAGVSGPAIGTLVAVNPSSPCNECPSCRRSHRNHCENMRFNGSAMRFPHEQGLFRECIAVPAPRVFAMGEGVSPEEAALCEPLAVSLHAVAQAGDLTGKTVLVSGCGPIGILVAAAARLAGAAHIVATDITPHSLNVARAMGCDEAIDVREPDALAKLTQDRGRIDVVLECSGAPSALTAVLPTLRPRGRLVLVGLGGDAPLPVNTIVVKELELVGTFRFDTEFADAARIIASRQVDFRPMLSAVYPMAQAREAFEHASDRTRATKVAITLD